MKSTKVQTLGALWRQHVKRQNMITLVLQDECKRKQWNERERQISDSIEIKQLMRMRQ